MHQTQAKTFKADARARCVHRAVAFMILLFALVSWAPARAAEVTEHQVKALCVLNFAKYVSWPDGAFPGNNTPIRIAVVNADDVARELKAAAAGKTVAGRSIVVVTGSDESAWRSSHIVYVGNADKAQTSEVLDTVRLLPVLTVGETAHFVDSGGVIRLVKRDNKVRFEIDLASSRRARLQISSKLLSLADVVKGKEEAK